MKTAARTRDRAASPLEYLPELVAWYALLAVCALLPLATSMTAGIGSLPVLTEDVYQLPKYVALVLGLLVATGAWAVDLLANRKPLRAGTPTWILAAFALLVGVSTALGLEPVSSLFGVTSLMTGAVTWLMCAWVFVLLGQYVVGARRIRELSWAIVGGSAVVAIIAVLQALGADPLNVPLSTMTSWMVDRGQSTLGNPNYTGLLMVIPVTLALALTFSSERSWVRWTAGAASVVLAAALFITVTRAAWLGAAVAVIAFMLVSSSDRETLKRRGLWMAAAVAAIGVAGLVLLGSVVTNRFTSLAGGLDAFGTGRITMWRDSLAAIANRPFFGTGADHFALGTYETQTRVLAEGLDRYVIQDPHSLPLLIAGLFGVPALLALGGLAGYALYKGWPLARSEGSGTSRLLYAAWVCGFTGFLVASSMSVFTITAIFTLFVALAVVTAPQLRQFEPVWTKVVAVALGAALLVPSAFAAVRYSQASYLIVLSRFADPQANLEAANALLPWDSRALLDYQWRKIGSQKAIIQGADAAAASDAVSSMDTEIKLRIQQFPHELLWYRMRIDLYRLAKGFPGYEPEKVLAAIDDALAVFPGDVELTEWRAEAAAELGK